MGGPCYNSLLGLVENLQSGQVFDLHYLVECVRVCMCVCERRGVHMINRHSNSVSAFGGMGGGGGGATCSVVPIPHIQKLTSLCGPPTLS